MANLGILLHTRSVRRVFCLLGFVASVSTYAISLPTVIRHTLNTNPQFFAALANQESSKNTILEAESGYYPHVSFLAGIGREQSASPAARAASGRNLVTFRREEASLVGSQLLFAGGRVHNSVRQRNYEYAASRFQTHDVREALILRAAEVFLNVLRFRKLNDIAHNNVQVHQKIYDKVKIKYKAGAGRRVDVQLGESRISRARAQEDRFRGDLRSATSRYYAVTGLAPDRSMIMPERKVKWLPCSEKQGVQLALEHSPVLHAAKAEFLASDARVDVSKSKFWPEINLELGASENENLDGIQGHNRDMSGMLVVRYDLINGGSDVAAFDAAKYNRRRTMRQCESVRRNVVENVRVAWAELVSTKEQMKELQNHVDASRKVVADYKKQFEIGARALFNVLDAENDFFNAQVALTNAFYNNAISYYRVLEASGRISAVLLGGLRVCA